MQIKINDIIRGRIEDINFTGRLIKKEKVDGRWTYKIKILQALDGTISVHQSPGDTEHVYVNLFEVVEIL